jgi:hypothetical protein
MWGLSAAIRRKLLLRKLSVVVKAVNSVEGSVINSAKHKA